MGYRASRQSSTKHSPYYMLFQQQMRLPVDSELLTSEMGDEENGEGVAEVIRHLLESRQKAFEKAESNIVQAQKYQKKCMTESISPMNCLRVHWCCWKILLKNSAKGVNCAQHGLDHTPSAETWAKGCMNSKTQLGALCKRKQTSAG